MKLAIFSDLHGNLTAFEAVLADLAGRQVERMLCLGDVVVMGPQPVETLRRLKELGCPVVLGNTDAWCLNPHEEEVHSRKDQIMLDTEFWGAGLLSQADEDFLRTFQPTLELELPGGRRLLACHGSPRSFLEKIASETPHVALLEMMAGVKSEVVACGHTHASLLRRVARQMVINPGSVGRPVEVRDGERRICRWAEYAILEVEGDTLSVHFHRVSYDVERAFELVRRSGMPHQAEWIGQWLDD
jgi:putative phosphoesterase